MRYRLLLSMLGLLAITSTPSAQPTANSLRHVACRGRRARWKVRD